jgi:hypothetical protein
MPTRGRRLAVAGTTLLATVAGCGGGSDAEQAAETVRAALTATIEGDGEAYCELLTSKGKEDFLAVTAPIAGDNAFDCPASFEKAAGLFGKDEIAELEESRDSIGPEDVKLRGAKATATYPSGRTQPLRKVDDWLIDGGPKGKKKRRR